VSTPGRPAQRLVVAAGALAVVALLLFLPQTRPPSLMRDFNAFYCAGAALDRGADPYRNEPLGSCERAPRAAWLNRGIPNLAAPAPLPPYALAPFRVLAYLPYEAAALAWGLVVLAAFGLTIWALRSVTRLPLIGLIAAFALVDGLAGWTLGQVAPLAVAAIALAVYFIEAGRDRAAAVAVAFAMIEPHVALPAALALFAWRRQTRFPLVAAGAACLALSFLTAGWNLNLEYVQSVLPAHAASEIASNRQLSLTNLAYRFGANDVLALRLGDASYLAMLAAGVLLAPVLARRAGAGMLVALPVAFVLCGGPFAHVVQTAAALPCALLLYARVPQVRLPLGIALAALAVPWAQFSSLGALFPALAALAVACVVWAFVDRRPLAIALGAALASVYLIAIDASVTTRIPDPAGALARAYDPHALAQASWGLYVQNVATWNVLAFDLARLPAWFGLIAIVAVGVRVAFPAPDENFARCENGGTTSRRIPSR
jgi:hypothetical protein